MACLALVLAVGLSGCQSDMTGGEAVAGVVVPCPGTSDPIPAGLQCGLVCRAALPIRASFSRLFLVDIQVNDKPVLVMIDTGSDRTALSPLVAARLGLPSPTLGAERIFTIGAVTQAESTTMRSVTFGHVRIGPGKVFLLPQSQAAAGAGDLGFDGVLGGDILSHYQVDLDFRHQMVRLYEGKRCPGSLPGWSAEAGAAAFVTKPGTNFVGVTAFLDGTPLKALLDTGMEQTIAGGMTASQLRADPSGPTNEAQVAMLGIGPGTMSARLHRFQSLGLGGMTMPQPLVGVVPEKASPWMIVGDTVLATRRVWIDYAGRQVHFGTTD